MGEDFLHRSRYIAILTIVAAGILIGGWFARPRSIPEDPAPLPSPTELEQLARRTERRSLENTADYFASVANDVTSSLAWVKSASVSAIVWDGTRLVSPPLPPNAGPVAFSGGGAAATVTGRGFQLPLAVLESTGGVPAHRAPGEPQAGDWLVAVWRRDSTHAFTPATYHHVAPIQCGRAALTEVLTSATFTRFMAGGGLFDLEGRLVAVILPCADRLMAIQATSVDRLIQSATSIEQRVLEHSGLWTSPLSAAEKAYFRTSGGLLVREVWIGSRADRAGLRPTDLILRVARQAVAVPEDLRALGADPVPGTSTELTVRRASREVTLALSPRDAADQDVADLGVRLDRPGPSVRIGAVMADSRAARAGLLAGDQLVRIDGVEPRSLDQLRRRLATAASAPMLLEVERGSRRLGIFVP